MAPIVLLYRSCALTFKGLKLKHPLFLGCGVPLTSELDAAAAAEADVVVSAAAAVAASIVHGTLAAAAEAADFVALRLYSTTLTSADYSYSGRPTW